MAQFTIRVLTSMKALLCFFVMPLPWFIKRRVLNNLLGYSIEKTAFIGLSIINTKFLSMASNAKIGHFNVIRSMNSINLDHSSAIGNLNWISGEASSQIFDENSNKSSLEIGKHSAITNRHYLDCSGGFKIGEYSTFAGVRSTLLSHSIDINESAQKVKNIKIGNYCFISSNCVFIGGSNIPDYSIVGAGSVVRNNYEESYYLYSGNPAKPIKNVSVDSKYFTRSVGHVN